MKLNEDHKAWLGLNKQDTLINISGVFFIFGYLSNNNLFTIIFFLITALLNIYGLAIYFTRQSTASAKVASINKWLTVFIVAGLWIFMAVKLSTLLST